MAWLDPKEAAAYAHCAPETIRVALRSGDLRGTQGGKAHGRWLTKEEWLDDWIMGDEALAA